MGAHTRDAKRFQVNKSHNGFAKIKSNQISLVKLIPNDFSFIFKGYLVLQPFLTCDNLTKLSHILGIYV